MLAQVTFKDCDDCGRTYDTYKRHECSLENYLEHSHNMGRPAEISAPEAGRLLECLRKVNYQEQLSKDLPKDNE